MSKARKAAYGTKQKVAAAGSAELNPLTENAPMPKTVKKAKTRKQSRGK